MTSFAAAPYTTEFQGAQGAFSEEKPRREYTAIVLAAKEQEHWLLWRVREEWACWCCHWKALVLSMFITIYGTTLLFPNLSYYRYGRAYGDQYGEECKNDTLDPTKNLCVPRRLQDIGYEMMPELKGEHGQIVDFPMFFLIAFTSGLTMFATLFEFDKHNKPYVINVIRRFLVTFAIGHILRLFCYMGTTVPGAAEYCLNASLIHPPQESHIEGFELFYKRKSTFGQNCGDLIFSGHLLITVSMFVILISYGQVCWGITAKQHKILVGIMFIPALAQTCMILAARHHYSVDIVIAWYTTPLLWNFHNTVLMPGPDFEPDQEKIAKAVLGRKGSSGVNTDATAPDAEAGHQPMLGVGESSGAADPPTVQQAD
eukprot:Hpha_TRINITY_DN9586_c0_g1::TRINITY_DN9586_c0_g1_i2::g.115019::m.115019